MATINVDNLQLFTNGTVGSVITKLALTNSHKGTGDWTLYSTGTVFEAWYVMNRSAVAFPSPVVVNGETYTNTGTTWVGWTNGAGSTPGYPQESMSFFLPGGEAAGFQKLTIRYFARFYSTNSTGEVGGTADNIDHVIIYGNPFGAFQQQSASAAGNAVVGHAGGGNGDWIKVPVGKLFFIVLRYNLTAQTMTARMYDPTNSFSTVLTYTGQSSSVGALNNTGNAWWAQFVANYLYVGAITGWTEITAPSLEWTTEGSDLGYTTSAASIGNAQIGNMTIGP